MNDRLSHPKRPRDFNQLAKLVIDVATGMKEEQYDVPRVVDDKAKKRGDARRDALTPEKRKAIASKAGTARWAKTKGKKRRK